MRAQCAHPYKKSCSNVQYSTHINVLSEYTDCIVDRVHMLKNRPNVQAMFTHFRKHLGSYEYIHTPSCSQQKRL